jgi:abhydrolase domain-containing protein 12
VTIDYRGFGYSTGSPFERGLIIDGISLVNWAIDVAGIPPNRIVLLGQSLGTAVATAVADHFITEENLEFKGIVLVAGFSDMPTLLENYAIGGFIPILSPLRPYPMVQKWFGKHIQETWYTITRLDNLVRKSKNINLRLIHAKDDYEIPWTHSNLLFNAAANATSDRGLNLEQIDAVKIREDLGGSGYTNTWTASEENCEYWENCGTKSIRQDIVFHGGESIGASVWLMVQ